MIVTLFYFLGVKKSLDKKYRNLLMLEISIWGLFESML